MELPEEEPIVWVFGYGSLMWKTDFLFRSKLVGHIKGHVRRFHQGNETFRGRPGQPGRVANLEKDENGQTWGVAFEIHGKDEVSRVMNALYAREVMSGGYVVMTTDFYPRERYTMTRPTTGSTDSLSSLSDGEDSLTLKDQEMSILPGVNSEKCVSVKQGPLKVLVFTVTQESDLYLGKDEIDKMARQIVSAKGSAGSNAEYITKTADFIRMYIPEDEDSHLFQLDAKVRELVYKAHARVAGRTRLSLSDIAQEQSDIHHAYPMGIVKAT